MCYLRMNVLSPDECFLSSCIMASIIDVRPLNPVFPWKGKTFSQVTSYLQKNKNSNSNIANYLLPNPLKIYRREIATPTEIGCSQRSAASIDEVNRPGGSIVMAANIQGINGIIGTVDPLIPNDTSVTGAVCDTCNKGNCTTSSTIDTVCFTDESKARRRCRSSGMIHQKYKTDHNNSQVYYTNTNQYLTSRNRLFSQNQFNYLRQGVANQKPGSAATAQNQYSPNGLPTCQSTNPTEPNYVQVVYKPSNSRFANQGGVSSSAYINRVRYDTVNTVAAATGATSNYGHEVANELAYHSSFVGYTTKDKVGYPNTRAPVIKPDGSVRACNNYIYRY